MSSEERERVHEEVHGTQAPIEENPEFVQDVFQRLDEHLDAIPSDERKEAFERAQLICPDYVNGSEFRLMFLRSTRFDAILAAQKIVDYWHRKVELFGPEKSFRKLSIRDMNEEDEEALNRGGFQALPDLDERGRGVWYSRRSLWDNRHSHRTSMVSLVHLLPNECST